MGKWKIVIVAFALTISFAAAGQSDQSASDVKPALEKSALFAKDPGTVGP